MINIYNKFTLYGGTIIFFPFYFLYTWANIHILNKNVHVQKQRDSLIKHVFTGVIFLCLHGNRMVIVN